MGVNEFNTLTNGPLMTLFTPFQPCLPGLSDWFSKAVVSLTAAVVMTAIPGPGRSANPQWGTVLYVNTPAGYALNLRWGPGKSFGVYAKVGRSCALEWSGVNQNGWLKLTNNTWVAANLVSFRSPPDGSCPRLVVKDRMVVTIPSGYGLNIRTGAGTNFSRVGQYANGTMVAVTQNIQGNWVQLTTGNWVDRTFLKAKGEPPNPLPLPDTNVMELQRRLRQAGFLPAGFITSGIYDQTTQAAVREFQRVNGLPVTGVVDGATWQALYNATGGSAKPVVPPPDPNGGEGKQMRVSTDGEDGLVFDGPGPEFNLLRSIPDGTIVTTTGKISGNWTELAEGGWIFSSWLKPL